MRARKHWLQSGPRGEECRRCRQVKTRANEPTRTLRLRRGRWDDLRRAEWVRWFRVSTSAELAGGRQPERRLARRSGSGSRRPCRTAGGVAGPIPRVSPGAILIRSLRERRGGRRRPSFFGAFGRHLPVLRRILSMMFLAYAGMAVVVLFGIVAIFSSMFHRRGEHDWIPTRPGVVIYAGALLLLILAGIWAAIRDLSE